ncbi:MAG TPA: AbfB domain-containing protein [Polyangiaceae bacterium]
MSRARFQVAALGVAFACACSLRSLGYLNEDGADSSLHGGGGTDPSAGEGGETTTGGTSSGGSLAGGTSSGGSPTGGASGSAGSEPVGGSSPTGGSDAGGGVSQGGSTGATGGSAGAGSGGAGAGSGGSAGASGASAGGNAGSGAGGSAGSGTGGSGPLRDETAYILRPGHAPAKCMDVNQYGKTEGTSVQQWSCFSQANQVFWARDYGSGSFALRNALSAKCVQVAMASSSVGAPIRQANCSGAAHQLWRPVAAGNRFQLVSEHSGFVIDVTGTESMTDGELLAQHAPDGLLDSTWTAEVATRGAFIALSIPGQTGTRAARMDAEVRMQSTNGPEAQWKVLPGLGSSGCVSFESRQTPGEFLRHSGNEMRSEPFESGAEFAGDATFCYRAPLAGTDIVLHALESLNQGGSYVTREGDTVVLAAFADTSTFRAAATWHIREP